jgi:phosphatidylglycerophosphatase A
MVLGFFLGGWEVVLILAILIILFGAKHLPPMAKGLGKGIDDFRKATDEASPQVRDLSGHKRRVEEEPDPFSIRLFVARGLGIGLIPVAPGTFGSLVGVVWFAMLLATGNFWAYLAGAIEGIAFSLWLCDDAEKILGEQDPPSVVIDEIIAIPFCFLPWVAVEWWQYKALPSVSFFFTGYIFWLTLGIVVLFRVFDIWKPWPVRQSQRLPGGWGVTIDDLLAAAYVALIVAGSLQFGLIPTGK